MTKMASVTVSINPAWKSEFLVPRVEMLMAVVEAALVESAQSKVPYRTGKLHDSIAESTRLIPGGSGEGMPAIHFAADTDYAVFVELGTRFMSARPYMIPALAEAGVML